jgi:hypothetical protein
VKTFVPVKTIFPADALVFRRVLNSLGLAVIVLEVSQTVAVKANPTQPFPSFAPPAESVAAIAQPSERLILPGIQPKYATEEELIQQMTGQPMHPSAVQATSTPPVFSPPTAIDRNSPRSASTKAPARQRASSVSSPVLVTTGMNSDVSLNWSRSETYISQPDNAAPPGIPIDVEPLPSNSFTAPSVSDDTSPSLRQPIAPASEVPEPRRRRFIRSTALGSPVLQLQGVYLNQGDESSARARLFAEYPLTPRVLVGATLDLTDGNAFTDSPDQGLSINELYLATALQDLPNLRFVVGQLDLTSYFDRNSFAKDAATHFFNPVFQTNPALSATNIASRPGALVNWSLNDNIEAKAAIFSSSQSLSDFSLDGFAGEVGLRYGNAIIRGSYATSRDAGSESSFQEIFGVNRGNNRFGIAEGDREESYGVNAEVFIPNLKLGLFGRYGWYNNRDADLNADTYNIGLSFLDLIVPNDRLGLAYGRGLSNDRLRRRIDDEIPDVLEVFYDFPFLTNLRLGVSLQSLNEFSETIAGFRIKTEFDLTPREQP